MNDINKAKSNSSPKPIAHTRKIGTTPSSPQIKNIGQTNTPTQNRNNNSLFAKNKLNQFEHSFSNLIPAALHNQQLMNIDAQTARLITSFEEFRQKGIMMPWFKLNTQMNQFLDPK